MARYTVTVDSPWSQEKAFAYMADLRNFVEWDPGVTEAELVEGVAPGRDAAYRVKANHANLRYQTVEYRQDEMIYVVADAAVFASRDRITVEPDGSGSRVTYDAELALKGPLGLLDPVAKLMFDRIAGKAAEGLVQKLDGSRLDEAPADHR